MTTREKTSILKTPDGYTVCFYGWPLKTFKRRDLAEVYRHDSAVEEGLELIGHIPIRHIPTGKIYPSVYAGSAAHYVKTSTAPLCRAIWKDSDVNRVWDLVEWPN